MDLPCREANTGEPVYMFYPESTRKNPHPMWMYKNRCFTKQKLRMGNLNDLVLRCRGYTRFGCKARAWLIPNETSTEMKLVIRKEHTCPEEDNPRMIQKFYSKPFGLE